MNTLNTMKSLLKISMFSFILMLACSKEPNYLFEVENVQITSFSR